MKKQKLTSLLTLSMFTLLFTVFIGTNILANSSDSASLMVNPENKVLVGYWHNWENNGGDGYKRGASVFLNLTDIPADYNVVNVSFMKSDGTGLPTFKPFKFTDSEFRNQISSLNAEGRTVLIALGGADAHIELNAGDASALADEIIRLVDVYGFDGLDIDLEQNAILAGENETELPLALKQVKDYYKTQGKNFLITMAPEFPYLKTSGNYKDYINSLEGYYDWINPQYYNQGGDGCSIVGGYTWLAQNNDAMKEEFLYSLTTHLVTGTDGFLKIPADKFVIGIPANNDAAATGYVINPMDVKNALDRLAADGNEIKGLMTWSVNWDVGFDKDGKNYGSEFVNRYAPIVFGGTTPPVLDTEAPSTPINLVATETRETEITLEWDSSTDNVLVKEYVVYRNGIAISKTSGTTFTDRNLIPDTEYYYNVTAVDKSLNESNLSQSVTAKTLEATGPITTLPNWDENTVYLTDDKVVYNGQIYIAKWWTQGNIPGGELWGPWDIVN